MNVGFKYKEALILAFIALIIFGLCLTGGKIARDYSFNGVVQQVSYDEKGIPTVTIKGVEYQLGYNDWGRNKDTIEVGDSMIKRKGDTHIKLIKCHRQ